MKNFLQRLKEWFVMDEPEYIEKGSLSNVKCGDLIGFEGKGLFSEGIKKVTNFHISHVGIAVEKQGKMYLIESTTLTKLPDAITGKYKKGVQYQILENRVKTYDGKVYHYPLKKELLPCQKRMLIDYADTIHEAQIDYDLLQALGSAIDLGKLDILNHRDNYKLFCSEMACEAYQAINLLPKEVNYSNQKPVDICKFPLFTGEFLL